MPHLAAASFVASHERELRDLVVRSHHAYWEAATTGSEEASEESARLRAEAKKLYARAGDAERVRGWLDGGAVQDPLVRRQLILMGLEYRGNAFPSETIDDIARREAELERTFVSFRAELDGEQVSDNTLRDVLRHERDPDRRRRAWEASKRIGGRIRDRLIELVMVRNEAARAAGYRDHYQMGLALQEQDEDQLFDILADFRERSEEAYREILGKIEEAQVERFGVDRSELRPWHWEDFFGQEAPSFSDLDLDRFFADGIDQVRLASEFLNGIGLPADNLLERSDLFEREGKSQHAFCLDMDREGDVRILCNLRPDEHWTMVLLHELGHAVYDKFIPPSLPFLLRTPAHTFSTEAIAMYMGRLTRNPAWLREVAGAEITEEEAADAREQLRAKMLVNARWMLVMAHFERALYRDPEREDLNTLWWDLVEEMQRIRRPEGRDEPDWAAKIHLSMAPVYYHNYLLGELMASQLSAHIDREVRGGSNGRSIAGDARVGSYLRERVFAPGATVDWNRLLVHATGEGLDPRFFVEEFMGEGARG